MIQGGADEVRIHGDKVPVRATIRSVHNYSAHADHSELIDWLRGRLPAHGAVFLTHGEDDGREAMRKALMTEGLGGDQVLMPLLDDYFELRVSGIESSKTPTTRRIDPEPGRRGLAQSLRRFLHPAIQPVGVSQDRPRTAGTDEGDPRHARHLSERQRTG